MNKHVPHTLIQNTLSYIGVPIFLFGLIAGGTLVGMDIMSPVSNPYLAIFIYLVLPAILGLGFILTLAGVLRERRRRRKMGLADLPPLPVINLNDRHQLMMVGVAAVLLIAFIGLSVVGGNRSYHFTESTAFCGLVCHEVMEPEYTAYQGSPHANVHCARCHIGPGADWFVKAKLSGLRQVVATARNTFSRPIEAPVHNLRPANETCYECHWPDKFFGAVELRRTYYRGDEDNTPWNLHMLINVGGGDVEHGRERGIHFHMILNKKIEYIATDEKRLEIPWVRTTAKDGTVSVFQTTDEGQRLTEEQVASAEIRTLDCIDCHNRPSHQYHSPERALNDAMASYALDPPIPYLKANASEALTGDYATREEAMAGIDTFMRDAYEGEDIVNLDGAIEKVKALYNRNFFPEMKVSWKEYPDHIGHMITPGCFRCHNGDHENESGEVITRECDSCHTILAQGSDEDIKGFTPMGLEFVHPEDIDEEWKETRCDECHEGVPIL